MPLRKFIFSCSTFGGFTAELNVLPHSNLEELTSFSVQILKDTLKLHNFDVLVEQLSRKCYHIHDRTVQDIIANSGPVYVCTCNR